LSVPELVAQFTAACLAQFDAERKSDINEQNKHIRYWMAISDELKSRAGDQRLALLKLYDHPNLLVRLNAARLTLAIAPTTARQVIQAIADSKKYPQAGDAGMCLSAIELGIFKPT
jgi:phage tail sheath protein FI